MSKQPVNILMTAFLACGVALTGKAQVAMNSPEQVAVNSHGNNIEQLNGIKRQYDDDALTLYAITADTKAVYIQLFITDSLQKRKLLQYGAEIWVDVKGKKNKVTGIMFPLSSKAGIYPGGGNRNAAGGPPPFSDNNIPDNKKAPDNLAQIVSGQTDMELAGFIANNGKQDIRQTTSPAVSIQLYGDTLSYSAIIPFESFTSQPLGKAISIGIIEKGMQIPGFNDMDGGPGGDMGGPPPGGDGGGGGMMGPPPGDGPPGGDFDMRRLFETNTIWYKLKLTNSRT